MPKQQQEIHIYNLSNVQIPTFKIFALPMLLKSESVELCTVNSLLPLLQTRLMLIAKCKVIILCFYTLFWNPHSNRL